MTDCVLLRLPDWIFQLGISYLMVTPFRDGHTCAHTCNTRLLSCVFLDSSFKSLASGLWFMEKYDFIVLSWWCLKEVRTRFCLGGWLVLNASRDNISPRSFVNMPGTYNMDMWFCWNTILKGLSQSREWNPLSNTSSSTNNSRRISFQIKSHRR